MLGLATADAVAGCPTSVVWHFSRAILTPDMWEAFETELTSRLRADQILFERFSALAATIVDEEVADPASCVPRHAREHFLAAISEWAASSDLASLNHALPGTDLYWGPSAELLPFVRALSRETFVTLLARFRIPHPVQAAIADRAITEDVQEIAALLRLAPATYDGDGVRIVSTIAPLLLWAGIEHLRRRIRWPDDQEEAEDSNEEALTADLAWAASEFTGAAFERSDGRSLCFAWATALIRDLAWRLHQTGRMPPLASDSGVAPAWFALNALVGHPSSRSWTGWRCPALASDDAYFGAVAATLPAIEANDPSGLAHERLPIPTGLDDAAGIEAIQTAVSLAAGPSDWIHQTLGWTISQSPAPAESWSQLWRSIIPFRERDLHRLGRKLETGSDAVAKVVWAIGLGALDWLSASDDATTIAAHDSLYPHLYDAALECWLTAPVPEEFWSNAVIHIAVRWSRLMRRRGEAEDQTSAAPVQESHILANIIGPFVAPSEHFLRMLRSLQRNGTSMSTIRDSLIANGSSLDDIVATANELGVVDARFAARTTELLACIAGSTDLHSPQQA